MKRDDLILDRLGRLVIVETGLRAPMRDGTKLAYDVYRPVSDSPLPALVALGPYGKKLQALSLSLPPQARPSILWDGCLEAGDIRRITGAGYAHVIGDVRGTGDSEGELCGNYGSGGPGEGKDVYDFVEFVAQQPWCDGNIGMVGISYYATVQILGAAEEPPHLKAVFCNGGHFDLYELAYHGGILWLMPRASREGRGGDSGYAIGNVTSRTLKESSAQQVAERVAERLRDPDIRNWPNLVHILNYPRAHELWFDFVMNPCNGPFYQTESALTKATDVKVPTYVQVKWGRGWTVQNSIELFQRLQGPKKLDLQPQPPMQERPFHESHEEMLRWYDFWLKGIPNGIMDEPPVRYFVEGAGMWKSADRWPLPEITWREVYLRPRQRLSEERECLNATNAPPDGFFQSPLTVSQQVMHAEWTSAALKSDVEMTGAGALYLHVEIDTEDTNLIAKLYDCDREGQRKLVTSGYLKASHRELDESKSEVGRPHHPHTHGIPVTPGQIEEYAIGLYPFSYVFKCGHSISLRVSCNEEIADEFSALLPPESYHLPSGRSTTHKIYRDLEHPSRLVLPVVTQANRGPSQVIS
ncbi:MAG: CocE/NonD family hydrolase [Thermoleophilia bacterium]